MGISKLESPLTKRKITILGSTGSIGKSTLDLIMRNPDAFKVEALTAYSNVKLLAEQARLTKAKLAVVADKTKFSDLKEALVGTNIEAAAGPNAVLEAAERPSDWVMAAIVGAAGLGPTLAAVRRGVAVALANKECLVCAGEIMLSEVKASGATLLPVDSEHNAIFQVFDFDQRRAIERIILTASGGPFWKATVTHMAKASPEEAMDHPNWDMGSKVSVDSATMMNKGLELIEAHYLFGMPEEKIDILVHTQSIVHSLVEYVDGSVLAQLGAPDMRTPISHALGWPKRISTPSPKLDLASVGILNFEKPDSARFPAIDISRQALRDGGAAPNVLNAANEVAVAAFLEKRIGFLDISQIIEDTLKKFSATTVGSLDDVYAVDCEARALALESVVEFSVKTD